MMEGKTIFVVVKNKTKATRSNFASLEWLMSHLPSPSGWGVLCHDVTMWINIEQMCVYVGNKVKYAEVISHNQCSIYVCLT